MLLDRVSVSRQFLECVEDAQASSPLANHTVLLPIDSSHSVQQFLNTLASNCACNIEFKPEQVRFPAVYDSSAGVSVYAVTPIDSHPNYSFKLQHSAIVAVGRFVTYKFYRDSFMGRGVDVKRLDSLHKRSIHEYGHILHDIQLCPKGPVSFEDYWSSLPQPFCERSILTAWAGRLAGSMGVVLAMTPELMPGIASSENCGRLSEMTRIANVGGSQYKLNFRVKFTRGVNSSRSSHIGLLMDWATREFEYKFSNGQGSYPRQRGLLRADTLREYQRKLDGDNYGKVFLDLEPGEHSLSTLDSEFTATLVKIPKILQLAPQYAVIR